MTPRIRTALLSTALLSTGLLGTLSAQAQVSIFTIPALPPRSAAPTPTTPTPVTPTRPALNPDLNPALATPHSANLSGPGSLRGGQDTTWTFNLTNLGEAVIDLQHGACDVRFEVLNAAGQVVRANPTNTVCTMQLVMTNVAPGETMDVQSVRWNGRGSDGKALPAGEYTIRAYFNGAGVSIVAEDYPVTLEN
ncbi:FlgD immunoglobulin-like domain containing protein [Deinococcus sp. UR1]|uniref:FlgD immunoglobulin-like domain containing protein n=1 Tax=Deinococcus sp. UR1 TaxID=1704277 RepID=UPI000C1A0B86|nr:FlgD immunoglobulin-like domain containing protein [Deinococcus sp. UR1]PIG98984.1 hypothetical protein AMD26_006975 [Deinococcus sp. UR1]